MKNFSVKLESLAPFVSLNDINIKVNKGSPVFIDIETAKKSQDLKTLVSKGLLKTLTVSNNPAPVFVTPIVLSPVVSESPSDPVKENVAIVEQPVEMRVEEQSLAVVPVEDETVEPEEPSEVLDLFEDNVLEAVVAEMDLETQQNKIKKNKRK